MGERGGRPFPWTKIRFCPFEKKKEGDDMPGRRKEPVDLIKAKGKSHHLTKEIEEERRAKELKVPFKEIVPPTFLKTKKRKDRFIQIAKMLDDIGIWTELDATVLGMFVVAVDQYERFTIQLDKTLKGPNIDWKLIEKTQMSQNTSFKQAQTCASKLGLTITDRCKIVAPQAEEEKPVNKFAAMMGDFDA